MAERPVVWSSHIKFNVTNGLSGSEILKISSILFYFDELKLTLMVGNVIFF